MTGPAKIGHVGSQNLTTFQTFGFHNFLFQYGVATKISWFFDNLFGFTTLLTEFKYYISVLRYVSSNGMIYFSPVLKVAYIIYHISCSKGSINFFGRHYTRHTHKPPLQDDIKLESMLIRLVSAILLQTVVIGNLRNTKYIEQFIRN